MIDDIEVWIRRAGQWTKAEFKPGQYLAIRNGTLLWGAAPPEESAKKPVDPVAVLESRRCGVGDVPVSRRTSAWDYHFFNAVRWLREGHLSMAAGAAQKALNIVRRVVARNTPESTFGGPFTKRAAWMEREAACIAFIGYCDAEVAENVARIAREEAIRLQRLTGPA